MITRPTTPMWLTSSDQPPEVESSCNASPHSTRHHFTADRLFDRAATVSARRPPGALQRRQTEVQDAYERPLLPPGWSTTMLMGQCPSARPIALAVQ